MRNIRNQQKSEREFTRYWEKRQLERLELARKRAEQARQFMEWKRARYEATKTNEARVDRKGNQ